MTKIERNGHVIEKFYNRGFAWFECVDCKMIEPHMSRFAETECEM